MLAEGGVASVQIEAIARSLRVSRSGFYWHFRNREAFLSEMTRYWSTEFTGSVIEICEAETLPPDQKIRKVSRVIRENRAERYDLSFWNWAQVDPAVKSVVEEVRDTRMRYIGRQIGALGFTGQELEARTRLFVVFHSWGSTMFDTGVSGEEGHMTDRILDVIVAPGP